MPNWDQKTAARRWDLQTSLRGGQGSWKPWWPTLQSWSSHPGGGGGSRNARNLDAGPVPRADSVSECRRPDGAGAGKRGHAAGPRLLACWSLRRPLGVSSRCPCMSGAA